MTDFKLDAETREDGANKLRTNGYIPAVVYGKDFENQKIALEKVNFMRLFKEAGTSNLIELNFGDKKGLKTLIHEVQLDPIKSEILHIDFFKVNMKEKIHAEIPLKLIGESPAVINLEGSLITNKDSIEVECLPGDLVSELEIDISGLDDFEKNIKVSDLVVPSGIEILDDEDEVLVLVQEPRSEEEMAELDTEVEENVENIEVEHKGEEAPEGEEGAPEGEKKPENNEKKPE